MVRFSVRGRAEDSAEGAVAFSTRSSTRSRGGPVATTDAPKLITVPQAARALQIGRSTAYDLAHAWLDSRGAEGLPVVRIGRTLRVPVAGLDRLFAIGGFGPAWNSGRDRRRGPRDGNSSSPFPAAPTPDRDID